MIHLACPNCGHALGATGDSADEPGRCPHCRTSLNLPSPGPCDSLSQESSLDQAPTELCAWARGQFNEDEFAAGFRDIRETGGVRFRDFTDKLEAAAGPDERSSEK